MYSVFFAYDMQPMDKMDDIVDIAIIEESVIVYNSKYWRAFDMNGQVSIPSLLRGKYTFWVWISYPQLIYSGLRNRINKALFM